MITVLFKNFKLRFFGATLQLRRLMNQDKILELSGLIREYGWTYSFHEPGTFETGWQTKAKKFRLLITGNDSFTSFSVCISKLVNFFPEQEVIITRLLNNFNNRSYFVKTYLNTEQEILMSADIFCQNKILYNDFRLALSVLTYYSHHLYRELSKINDFKEIGLN